MNKVSEINRLTNRHIAKLMTKLNARYNLEPDIEESIKVSFRHLQDDIINNLGLVQNDGRKADF